MRLIIHGATGRMGKAVTELAEQNGHTIAAKAAPGYMQDAPDKPRLNFVRSVKLFRRRTAL